MRTTKLKEKNSIEPLFGLREISGIDPNSFPVVYDGSVSSESDSRSNEYLGIESPHANLEVRPETKKALSVLWEKDFDSKLFCRATTLNEVFIVKSDNWDWIVTPVSVIEQLSVVPEGLKRGIQSLIESNVKVDSIAIAKPKNRESVAEVIKDEFSREGRTISQIIIFSVTTIFSTIREAGRSAIDALDIDTDVKRVEIPDPVLLVKISNTNDWVEIGRWI